MPTPTLPGGTWTPTGLPPVLSGVPTAVLRYAAGSGFTPLPSVRWLSITHHRGPQPSRAVFRYGYPPDLADAPVWFEDFLPTNRAVGTAAPTDLLHLDDRIVVVTIGVDGGLYYLFDGFVQIPEASINETSYGLVFSAQGVPIRCWDYPIKGSRRRQSNWIEDPEENVFTLLPPRVNPGGEPNASGDPNSDLSWDRRWPKLHPSYPDQPYPVFVDHEYPRNLTTLHPVGPYVRPWSLSMVARYVLAEGNGDMVWVANPDFMSIGIDLAAAVPGPGGVIDPGDPSSYTLESIRCRDMTLEGPWPEVLWNVIRHHGFSYSFRLDTGPGNLPRNTLVFERERDNLGSTTKSLYLQPAGTTIDVGASNVVAFSLARDGSQVVNAYDINSEPDEFEVGIVLTPGFKIEATDIANAVKWLTTNNDPTADRDKYRLFIADECGEGHWSYSAFGDGNWTTGSFFSDFMKLFGPDFHIRRRPGHGPLITTDIANNPERVTLCLMSGYEGPAPALMDWTAYPAAKIMPIKSSWRLLDDRLGIRITAQDPRKFAVGDADSASTTVPTKASSIDLLTAIKGSRKQAMVFLLTCVVPSDFALQAFAEKRASSAGQYTVYRRADGRDRYTRKLIHKSSFFAKGSDLTTWPDSDPRSRRIIRDDTKAALTYAQSLRAATESPSFGGSAMIRRLTNMYQVGDRIDALQGRMSLQTNNASEAGEGARYPILVQVTWTNDGEQSTTLHLDDRRAMLEPIEP